MTDTILLLLSSGICGVIQNNFVVKMKHKAFFLPVACFAVVIIPFLYVDGAIPCMLYTLLLIAASTAAGCMCYEGPFRFRLYNLLLQHILTLSILFMADALSCLGTDRYRTLIRILLTVVLDLTWVGIMLYAHLHVFTLIPLEEENYRQALWYCAYAVIILSFAVIIRKDMVDKVSEPAMVYVIFSFLSATAVFAMILALQWNSTAKPKMLMERQLQAIVLQNSLLTQQVEDEISFNNRLREVRHDHRCHLTALNGLLGSGQYEQALTLLHDLIKSSAQPQGELYSDHPLINVILRELAGKCQEIGTCFRYTIRLPEKICIPDTELIALLMNITNNAVECCQKLLDPSQAFIHIFLYLQNGFFVVKCKNTVDVLPQIFGDRIVSSKSDPHYEHGIGLESIHFICQKHEGKASLTAKDHVFTITAVLKNI